MPSSDTPDLKTFARDVARELTPPLTALWSRIEVMLAEMSSDRPPASTPDDLEMLRRHAVRMVGTVRGLLCLSGEPVLEVRPVDLNAIVEDSLSPIASQRARRQVEIESFLDGAVTPVLADGEALRYVLTSLIETAADTMTTVQVMTQRVGEDGVRVHIGTSRQTQAERDITPDDGLRVVLAEAIVRSLDGTLTRRDGNPVATYVISLRRAS
jgi:signal transduction histidine kinase